MPIKEFNLKSARLIFSDFYDTEQESKLLKDIESYHFKKDGGTQNEPVYHIGDEDLESLKQKISSFRSNHSGSPNLIHAIEIQIVQQQFLFPKSAIIMTFSLKTEMLDNMGQDELSTEVSNLSILLGYYFRDPLYFYSRATYLTSLVGANLNAEFILKSSKEVFDRLSAEITKTTSSGDSVVRAREIKNIVRALPICFSPYGNGIGELTAILGYSNELFLIGNMFQGTDFTPYTVLISFDDTSPLLNGAQEHRSLEFIGGRSILDFTDGNGRLTTLNLFRVWVIHCKSEINYYYTFRNERTRSRRVEKFNSILKTHPEISDLMWQSKSVGRFLDSIYPVKDRYLTEIPLSLLPLDPHLAAISKYKIKDPKIISQLVTEARTDMTHIDEDLKDLVEMSKTEFDVKILIENSKLSKTIARYSKVTVAMTVVMVTFTIVIASPYIAELLRYFHIIH